MEAAETSEASLAVAPAPIRAPAWPAAMAAASLAVAATFLAHQLWTICSRGRLALAEGSVTGEDALWYASYAPDMLLVLAAGLLLFRKRAGAILHIVYAVPAIAVIGTLAGMNVLDGLAFSSLGPTGPRPVELLVHNSHHLIHMAYPICVLVWFARPKIIRQLRDWDRLIASPAPARPGVRYAHRVWPSAVGAASIALGSLNLAWFLNSTMQSFYFMPADNPYLQLRWFWLHWLGRIDIPGFCFVLMPGVFAVSLTLAGIGLLRRWWAAIPLHLALVVMMQALMLCIRSGMPWDKHPFYFDFDPPQILIRLLAMPMFSAYPLFLLVWCCWPGVRKQAFVWYRVTQRRNRRHEWFGRVLTAAMHAACFTTIIMLPVAVAAWRCMPKPPPGIEFFGQAISLPRADQGTPPCWGVGLDTIVCLGEDGSLYLDGRKHPSLDALRQALATAKRANPSAGLHLAIDERTPFSLAWPVLEIYLSSLPSGQWWVSLLVKRAESDSNWMDDLSGSMLGVRLSSPASASTAPAPARQIRVWIAANGEIALDGRSLAKSDLSYRLLEESETTPNPEVLISAADGAPFGSVVAVLNACKRAGIREFALLNAAETQPASTRL